MMRANVELDSLGKCGWRRGGRGLGHPVDVLQGDCAGLGRFAGDSKAARKTMFA